MKNNRMLEIAKKRYTTKHYSGKQIPREDLADLMEVLRLSPSSVNSQPWHFFIASSQAAKERIAPAFADFNRERVTLASDVIVFAVRDGIDEAHFKRLLEKEIADGRFAGMENEPDLDAGRRHFTSLHAEPHSEAIAWEARQAYIALGFLLFAADGMGIDSTCLEGADFDELDRMLGLREKGLRSVVAASLGYRAENDSNASRPKSRLTAEEIFTTIE